MEQFKHVGSSLMDWVLSNSWSNLAAGWATVPRFWEYDEPIPRDWEPLAPPTWSHPPAAAVAADYSFGFMPINPREYRSISSYESNKLVRLIIWFILDIQSLITTSLLSNNLS